jgi:hypothetical protein
MELKLERKKIDVCIDGSVHTIKFPTVKQTREFQLNKDEKKSELDQGIDFLVSLGMPREICEELEMAHVKKIFDLIESEVKKN